jgi:hypothetical protein
MHPRTRWTLYLAMMILLGILSGCGGGGSSSSDGGGGSSSGDGGGTLLPAKNLSWAPPESFTDTSSLDPRTDLQEYEIYVSESGSFSESSTPSAVVRAVDTTTHTLTTSFNLANIGNLSTGVVYRVSMRAVAVTGIKSDFSPPASFSF